MSDFLIYAARLQDNDIHYLSIKLGVTGNRYRSMEVTPDSRCYPPGTVNKWPKRTFLLNGDDPVLIQLKDDLMYDNETITQEMIDKVVSENPLHEADLREWFKDWSAMPHLDEKGLDEEGVSELNSEGVNRVLVHTQGMLKGIGIGKELGKMPADKAEEDGKDQNG